MRRYHSPSSTELGARCRRAWAYRYLDGLREPSVDWTEDMAERLPPGVTAKQRSAALGTAGHTVLEAWYRGDSAPAWHSYPGQVVEAGRHLLPMPSAVIAHVERPIGDEPIPNADPDGDAPAVGFRFDGVLWAGYRDLVVTEAEAELARLGIDAPAGVALLDYKTTASIAKYAKSEATLTADLQCNLYALATMAEYGLDALPARWVYFETKAVRRAMPTDIVILRAAAEARVSAASALARELDTLTASTDAPQNLDACGDYGGCSYHESKGGPCNAQRTFGQLLQLGTKGKSMALDEEQKAKFAKFRKPADGAEAPPPPPEQPSPTDGGDSAATPSDPTPPPAAPKPKAIKKPAAPSGSLAEIVGKAHAEIAKAEAELAAAAARRDAAVAALREALS